MDLRLELHIRYEPNYRQGKYQVLVGEARRGEADRQSGRLNTSLPLDKLQGKT